jgi:hypothetical protein
MAVNFGGGLSGAASGAAIGSSFGPIGTGVGAAVGGIAGLFGGKKKKKKPKPVSTLDPQQQGLYNDYVGSLRGQGPLKDLYNYDVNQANQVFDANTARPAYRGFQENIIPNITGQFRQNNLMNSSYTGEALGRAGRNVQENLDALRAQQNFAGQQGAQQSKQDALNKILNMQTFANSVPQERAPSTIDQILGSVAPQAGNFFADFLKPRAGTSGQSLSGASGYSNSLSGASGKLFGG